MDSNSFIQLTSLNFPEKYQFRLRKVEDVVQIFCPVRKNWFVNTPEEWVRQHCLHYLHHQLNYPLACLIAEYPVTINGLNQRVDILVMENSYPKIVVECKRPSVVLNQDIIDQALRYTQIIGVKTLYLTNGIQHWFGNIDFDKKAVNWIESLPAYRN